jgi:hypothetical protein
LDICQIYGYIPNYGNIPIYFGYIPNFVSLKGTLAQTSLKPNGHGN